MGMISVSFTVCMVDDVGDVSITIWDNVLGKIPRNVGPDVCFAFKENRKEKRKYFRKFTERSPMSTQWVNEYIVNI